jgi:hypothetical protein
VRAAVDEQERVARTEDDGAQAPEEAVIAGVFFQAGRAELDVTQGDTDPAHCRGREKGTADCLRFSRGGDGARTFLRWLEMCRTSVQGQVIERSFVESKLALERLVVGKAVEQGNI